MDRPFESLSIKDQLSDLILRVNNSDAETITNDFLDQLEDDLVMLGMKYEQEVMSGRIVR